MSAPPLREILSCTCHRAALGDSSPPDGIGHLHRAAGGIAGGPVLPAHAVLLHPRRDLRPRTLLVRRRRAGLPAGDGQQGGHGLGPVDGFAVRSGFLGRLLPRGLATALRRLPCPGVYLGFVGVAGDRGGRPRRLGRFRRRGRQLGLPLHPVRGYRPLPEAICLAAPAVARLRSRHRPHDA